MEKHSQRVMIWGGAHGLGKQIARQSVGRGHDTCITSRKPKEAMEDPELAGITKCDFADFSMKPMPDSSHFLGRDFEAHSLNADILFWVAGHWLHKPFEECESIEMHDLWNVHLLVPMTQLRSVLQRRLEDGYPPHLVVVASSSAWKTRNDGQAMYGAVQAAKVQFARNLHAELALRFREVRTTIVRPGGMKTGFFKGTLDLSAFADTAEVAEVVWSRVDIAERPPLLEIDLAQRGNRLAVECTPVDPLRS